MNLASSAAVLAFLQTQGYLIILILFIIEGPILNYAAGFASSIGFFNAYIILLLGIAGNVIGDLIYYAIGRFGKKGFVEKYVNKLLEHKGVIKIKDVLNKNPGKTLAVIKLTPGLPVPGLVLAGITEMPIRTFLTYSIILSTLSSSFFVITGYYSGYAFNTIYKNFNYGLILIAIFVIFVIGFWMLIMYLSKKIAGKIEKIN